MGRRHQVKRAKAMTIVIVFKLRGSSRRRRLRLRPEDYLDPLDPGEVLDIDCVPRHPFASRYLVERGIDGGTIEWTELEVALGRRWERVRHDFLAQTELQHIQDSEGYEELIHTTSCPDSLVVRTRKQADGRWVVVMSTLLRGKRERMVDLLPTSGARRSGRRVSPRRAGGRPSG